MKRAYYARRYPFLAAPGHQHVNARAVFERDGWRCRLCGELVDRTKQAPHPRSPSVDHIVPLAKGGAHTYANVQCAHFGCNSKKGARDGGQLRLAL